MRRSLWFSIRCGRGGSRVGALPETKVHTEWSIWHWSCAVLYLICVCRYVTVVLDVLWRLTPGGPPIASTAQCQQCTMSR